jgi:hypothetical protein
MSTNADFDFDFEEPKTNRINAASDSADGFDFDDDFLNDTSVPNTIEPKKSVSEQKNNDISFDFEDNKQNTELDDSFDFEKEDSTISPKKDNDFSFEIDTEQEPEKSDFDNDFMISPIENQKKQTEFVENKKEIVVHPKKEEHKKFDSFDDVEMDEDENIPISTNNDKKVDYSIKNDIIENNDFDSNTKKKGFFMAKNKKEDLQEEVFDEELEENDTEIEETEEKPKPIFLQKWFIPAVGGVLFAGFIGVKMMNGELGGGHPQPVQQLTQQNQQIQQPPAMFEENKPEENALQQPIQSEQQPIQSEQQPMVAEQQPSISNSEMIRMASEQKQLLDEQMQETNLKINNQNIRLDKIENNIGQISNNMVLIATSLTELKNSFESKQAQAAITPKLEKEKKEKVKTKETVVSENRNESTSKHSNHYHNSRVSQEETYSKKNEPLYGNVKMAINGSAWVVNSKGETVELRTGDYNSQYGKILSIDENSLIVKTSKGSLHSNY